MESVLLWTAVLVIPAAAVVSYWQIARRQVRTATRGANGRVESERALTARVSHQVRDPLTVIFGFSEALLDTELDDDVRNVVSIINAEALSVSRTVENLVAANQVATKDLQVRAISFSPAIEIDRAVVPFRRLGATITLDGPDLVGESDPILFRQVIQNLVANAVRHGGAEISVVAQIRPGWYEVTIADDGPGLPRFVASRLFPVAPSTEASSPEGPGPLDRSDLIDAASPTDDVTTNEDAEDGLRIGLPVAIAIARELGGSVSYESVDGATMFTFAVPTAGWPDVSDRVGEAHEGDHEESIETEADDEVSAPLDDAVAISFGRPREEASGSDLSDRDDVGSVQDVVDAGKHA